MGCSNLGLMYHRGKGTEKNNEKAIAYLNQACDGGYALGCSNLGLMYHKGDGVEKNEQKAKLFFKRACIAGYVPRCKEEQEHH